MGAGVDGEVGKVAGAVLHQPFGGDHGGVVGAVAALGKDEADAVRGAGLGELLPQIAVGDHPAPRGDGIAALLQGSLHGALGEHVAGGALEGGGHVCPAVRFTLLLFVVAVVDDGRL